MTGNNTVLLVVSGGIASEFEDISGIRGWRQGKLIKENIC